MTPEQLKEYIDAALRQRYSFTLVYFVAVPIMCFLAAFIGGYLKEKARNTATKEDIGTITRNIEETKSEYAERLEQLRTSLLERSYYSKIRYEREMRIYEEIWPKLVSLREAVHSLRPFMDTALDEGETDESRKRKRGLRYLESDRGFARTVEYNRPFYPPEIWSELRTLLKLCWGEAVEYRCTDQERDWEKYWDKANENAKAIDAQVDQVCEAIRTRLTKFDHV